MSTIRENLLVLIEAVEAEPLFDLSAFEKQAPCGTLHCTLGLAATMPHFYLQGLEMVPGREGRAAAPAVGGTLVYKAGAYDKLDQLFGADSYDRLFEPNGDGEWDVKLQEVEYLEDRELALARLNKQLELYP